MILLKILLEKTFQVIQNWFLLPLGAIDSLELWYNTILVFLIGNMKNAQVAIYALSIWYFFFLFFFLGFSLLLLFHVYIGFLICNLNINGWEMMISFGFLATTRYHYQLKNIYLENLTNSLTIFWLGTFQCPSFKWAWEGELTSSKVFNCIDSPYILCYRIHTIYSFMFFRKLLAYIFTDSHDVAKAIADLSPLLACSMLLNSVNQFSHVNS